MQFVKTADLQPGMRLAKPIYNKMGVLLYERDTLLTAQGIHSIENFGLIGIFILEPAEPVPPLSREDLEFEQLQTVYMFKLKGNMDRLQANQSPTTLVDLVKDIQSHYGGLDHKLNFTQNLRSSADFIYKHSISAGILCAMITNQMRLPSSAQSALITAALLYDFGYLYVPHTILDKGDDLADADKDFIQLNLERGYETLAPNYQDFQLPAHSLEIIHQMIFQNSSSVQRKQPPQSIRLLVDILKVADKFDRLTAMNVNKSPISEVAAMKYLKKEKSSYNPLVLAALAKCIHILPTGACVDLSNGEKALVLADNPANFLQPMILKFSTNEVIDLSEPENKNISIKDTMKTMDNRIALDKDSIKHFTADAQIKKTADRFRRIKLEAAQYKQEQLRQMSANRFSSLTAASASAQPSNRLISNIKYRQRDKT